MKTLLLGLALVSTAHANTDLNITLRIDSDLKAIGSASYVAMKDSFLCTRFSTNEGSPTRIPKRIYKDISANNGKMVIPQSIPSDCDYQRVGGASLSFTTRNAEPYNVVTVYAGGGNSSLQEIDCEEMLSGPSGRQVMIRCDGDVNTNSKGEAFVRVNMR